MRKKRQQVRYEFFNFESTTTPFSTTLTLENPAEIKFYNVSTFVGGKVTINNSFILDSINAVAPTNPSNLFLTNNVNEYDVTVYQINLQVGTNIKIVVKYYID